MHKASFVLGLRGKVVLLAGEISLNSGKAEGPRYHECTHLFACFVICFKNIRGDSFWHCSQNHVRCSFLR